MGKKILGTIYITVPIMMLVVILSAILGWFQTFVFFGSIGLIAGLIGMFLRGISMLSEGNTKS